MLNYVKYSPEKHKDLLQCKVFSDIITIDRKLLVDKVDEIRSVLGDTIYDGIFIVNDFIVTQNRYLIRWSENVSVTLFLSYDMLELFAEQPEKRIEFSVNNGVISDIYLLD